MKFVSEEMQYELTIKENDIRAPGYFAQSTGDKIDTLSTQKDECNTYAGSVNEIETDWLRLFISNEIISGVISDTDGSYIQITPLFQVLEKGRPDGRFIISRLRDLKEVAQSCGVDAMPRHDSIENHSHRNDVDKLKFSTLSATSTCRILEVAADADYEFFSVFGATLSADLMISSMNQADGIYNSTFNTKVILTFINIYTTSADPYTSTDAYALLDEFRNFWNTYRSNIPRDVAHLFTDKDLDGNIVGLAWVGSIGANSSFAYGLSQYHGGLYATVSHEIGHGFNADHDVTSDCAIANTMMCSGGTKIWQFSTASQVVINNFMNSNQATLLNLNSFRIIGPSIICSTGNFSTNDYGERFSPSASWSTNSPSKLSIASTGGAATKMGDGYVTVQATMNSSCGTITLTKPVQAGVPYYQHIIAEAGWVGSGVKQIHHSSETELEAKYDVPSEIILGGGNIYEWDWSIWGHSNWQIVRNRTSNKSAIDLDYWQSPPYNPEKIYIRARNECGWGNYQETFWTVTGYYGMLVSNVYPNPAKSVINLELKSQEEEHYPDKIQVYSDQGGTLVKKIQINEAKVIPKQLSLDLSDLKPGIYFIHIFKNDYVEKKRVVLY